MYSCEVYIFGFDDGINFVYMNRKLKFVLIGWSLYGSMVMFVNDRVRGKRVGDIAPTNKTAGWAGGCL